MSYTEIYKFDKAGNASSLKDIKNAFRGAMAVWAILDKKYLPAFIPEWAKYIPIPNHEYSRASDQNGIKEIWALFEGDKLSKVDKIVLGSTFDKVIVMKENLSELIQAFREFDGETSLKEQADVFEEALKDEDLIAVAWNQTSVNSGVWENQSGEEDEDGNQTPYNLFKEDAHWNLFEDVNKEADKVEDSFVTLKKFNDFKDNAIIGFGTTVDSPKGANITNSGRNLMWVAKKGGGGDDWAIYISTDDKSMEYILENGTKVISKENILKLVPCDKEVFEKYRY